MDIMKLIIDFHIHADRQGPGSDVATLQALQAIPDYQSMSQVLDIGCGTGAQTLTLARNLKNANITALDLLPEFLAVLEMRIEKEGLRGCIKAVEGSMDSLPFADNAFDLVWAEGCIYHIGFERGLTDWKRVIKPSGYLVVSELCWLSDERPQEIADYWINAYPGIATIEEKIVALKKCGYEYLAHFPQGEDCWTENYYQPIRSRTDDFAKKHNHAPEVMAFLQEGIRETDIYAQYKDYYTYVFFIMRKGS